MSVEIQKKVLDLLNNTSPREWTIKEVSEKLMIDRDTASKHLAILHAQNKIEEITKGNVKLFHVKISDKDQVIKTIEQIFPIASRNFNSPSIKKYKELLDSLKKQKEANNKPSNED